MANKTEKPSNQNPNPSEKAPRKPRTPHTPTALEQRVTESLAAQKLVARALRGVAKAVSKLSPEQARTVLGTALEAVSDGTTGPGDEVAGS